MWCQLLKESYHCYWILSLIWLAIALHLLLTTPVSTRGSFANATGLAASTERPGKQKNRKTARLVGSVVVANGAISVLC